MYYTSFIRHLDFYLHCQTGKALGNQKPSALLQVEKLLWKALIAVAQGKITAWAALAEFVRQVPWDVLEQATGGVRTWFAPGTHFFHFATASLSHGPYSATDSEGDAQAGDNLYCLDLEGPVPNGWPLELLPPAISSEDKAPSNNATNSDAAALEDDSALTTPSEPPAIEEMDIDEDGSRETESLLAKSAASPNGASLAAAGSSASASDSIASLAMAAIGLGTAENQDLPLQRPPSARNGGSPTPNIENHARLAGETIHAVLKDLGEESDLTDIDPPDDNLASEEEDADLDSEMLGRENLKRKPLNGSKISANSKSRLNPRSPKHRSRSLQRPALSGKRKFARDEDPCANIERLSSFVDLNAVTVNICLLPKCFYNSPAGTSPSKHIELGTN